MLTNPLTVLAHYKRSKTSSKNKSATQKTVSVLTEHHQLFYISKTKLVSRGELFNLPKHIIQLNLSSLNQPEGARISNWSLLANIHLYKTDLGELDLSNNRITSVGFRSLAEGYDGFGVFKDLCVLILAGNDVGDAVSLIADKCRKLRMIDLTGNGVGDVGAMALGRMAKEGYLSLLDLGGNKITDYGAKMLMIQARNAPYLSALSLHENPMIGEEGNNFVLKSMFDNLTMQFLTLSLADCNAVILGHLLAENVGLLCLRLYFADALTEQSVKNICIGIAENMSVQRLDMYFMHLFPGFEHLVLAMVQNTTITRLSLGLQSCTEIDMICDIIKLNIGLNELEISTTLPLTRLQAQTIAHAQLVHNPSLQLVLPRIQND